MSQRECQARNGVPDLDVDSGLLSDPSANYSSPDFVKGALRTMATVCRRALSGRLLRSRAVGLVADETTGADGDAHLVVLKRLLTPLGGIEMAFLYCIEMHLDTSAVRGWVTDVLGHQLDVGYAILLKGGLNMAYLLYIMLDAQFPTARIFERLRRPSRRPRRGSGDGQRRRRRRGRSPQRRRCARRTDHIRGSYLCHWVKRRAWLCWNTRAHHANCAPRRAVAHPRPLFTCCVVQGGSGGAGRGTSEWMGAFECRKQK